MIKYLVVYEKTKTGYSAYVPDIPGVIATGKTKSIVEKNIFGAIQFHIEGMNEENSAFPNHRQRSISVCGIISGLLCFYVPAIVVRLAYQQALFILILSERLLTEKMN